VGETRFEYRIYVGETSCRMPTWRTKKLMETMKIHFKKVGCEDGR